MRTNGYASLNSQFSRRLDAMLSNRLPFVISPESYSLESNVKRTLKKQGAGVQYFLGFSARKNGPGRLIPQRDLSFRLCELEIPSCHK